MRESPFRPADDEDQDTPDDDEDDGTEEVPLNGDATAAREPPLWLAVLPWCASIVAVFRRCQPQLAVGMGVHWQGVTATEVRAACLMLGIRRAEWARHIDGVQYMARVVANVRNQQAADK